MYSDAEIDAVRSAALLYELKPSSEKGQGRKNSVFVCPSCGHGRILNPTAAGIWYCQHCKKKGDVFMAVRLRDGLTKEEAFVYVMNKYADGQKLARPERAAASSGGQVDGQQNHNKPIATDAWKTECRRYLMAAAAAFPGSAGEAYMQGRGFTVETLKRFRVGFDARAKVHGVLKFGRPAVVYPYSRRLDYYAARFLKPFKGADGKDVKAMKPPIESAGEEPLFNALALYSCEAVVVCEGAFDAMAIAQGAASIGANVGAVALGGTGCGKLIEELTAKPSTARLYLALDNDEAGRAGALAAAGKLDAIGQPYELMDSEALFAGCKDAGEVLQRFGTDGAVAIIDCLVDGARM